MTSANWIQYLTAVGSIATPILVLLLSALGWRFKRQFERQIELENKLRDDRIDIYNKLLEPFIILFMSDTAWESDKKTKNLDKGDYAAKKMLSLEYRRIAFKMSLTGSDGVVFAYNNLMQYFYNSEEQKKEGQLKAQMELLGKFLLEIRKSMGNEATELDNWDMCEWWMSDLSKIKNGEIN
ncbi:hypothetical protein GCM10008090_23160 [Arenicella chitinivorans]|uniref:DUF4760 domain-containing protein n=1 Tax=Arenicella chitinivorans TaxID=1329800 RepID=A0A918RX47_9GAMM|nr:hypothetical protein [Arenicella chitinivorans]GHA12849.1 hypothetical protein GCM10008090_23160 [Arenicella chitinivorans]